MDAKASDGPRGPGGGPPGGGFPGRPGMGGPGMRHMRGGQDLTEGPIFKTLIMFSLPVMWGNLLQSLSAAVNQFWVSHTLGIAALAALGNANQIMMLMMGAIFGVTMSANILIAQAVGSGNLAIVKRVMGTAMTFFFTLSVVLAAAGLVFTPAILAAMGTPVEARADAITYLRIIFVSMPFQYYFMFLQMAQRGAGDSRTPLYFQIVAIVITIIMNPVLIVGWGPFPALGIAGSAASGLIGQGVALVLLFTYLYRSHSVLLLRPNEMRLLLPDTEIMQSLLLRGVPMGLQMFIMSGSAVMMVWFVNNFHSTMTVAAYFAALQVWTYLQMPVMAVGASLSSMVGQNIGAEKWDRVDAIARAGIIVGLAITTVLCAVIYLLEPYVLQAFLPIGSPAIPVAQHINLLVMWSFILFAVTFPLSGVVRATGAVWVPLAIMAITMVGLRIPFAYYLQPLLGHDAVWWSMPLSTIASAILTALYYRYGNWRELRMLSSFGPPGGRDTAQGQASDGAMAAPAMDPPEADEIAAEAVESGAVKVTEPN
jgi:putative MATE family efflux protein